MKRFSSMLVYMAKLDIIFEDDQILLVNKPAGIGTQAPRQFDSLEARVREYLVSCESEHTPYLGIPHRIDRCVSGIIVFAKRKKAAQRLAKQFERREVEKSYVALVSGHVAPESGTWTDTMRKIPEEPRGEIVPPDHEDAKQAVLHYEVTSRDESTAMLKISLETGRMHQIRIQCAARGHAILGDEMYGSQVAFGSPFENERDRQIALHAITLRIEHPRMREKLSFSAPKPANWPTT